MEFNSMNKNAQNDTQSMNCTNTSSSHQVNRSNIQNNQFQAAFKEFMEKVQPCYLVPKNESARKSNYPSAYKKVNKNKNRYFNVPATEQTRVKLLGRENGQSDYINANRLRVPRCNTEYIACQAPTPKTYNDFWQMIWQENSRVIVCLTPESSQSGNIHKEDCMSGADMEENVNAIPTSSQVKGTSKYWPQPPVNVVVTDNFQIKLISCQSTEKFHVRLLQLFKNGEHTRRIVQIQYTAWEDFGTPKNPFDILQILKLTNYYQQLLNPQRRAPLIVHCSAGLGRTGMFVSIASAIELINCGAVKPNQLNVCNLVRLLRSQRHGMVQNAIQYACIYSTIGLYVQTIRTFIQQKQNKQIYNNTRNASTVSN